ncbi:MAG: ATP-binding protein [Bacteroidales bacterium]|nr:ATP-binding protein [Bacteroidales bacterium]
MQKIIGRAKEISELNDVYTSGVPEFVVIYGRRRVGKTFLIREMFAEKFAFYHTGLAPQDIDETNMMNSQLNNFASSLRNYGEQCGVIKDWISAFSKLKTLLINRIEKNPKKRQVVFIDELPWLDTPRSQFISALEHFWNGWGSGISQLMLIVCGSAIAWISDNLLHNKGGLYNRKTREIKLHSFTLCEAEQFYKSRGIVLNRYTQSQLYMMIGGIPYYMTYVEKGKSLEQITDNLFANRNGKLRNELDQLFVSLFTNHEECLKIIKLLSKSKIGYTRKEIAEITKIPYGGGLTKTLKALAESDFICQYTYYGKPSKEERYRLVDFFTIYQLSIINNKKNPDSKDWKDRFGLKVMSAWYGTAFEALCWNHIYQIKNALGIPSVHTEEFSWRVEASEITKGAQIDLMIRRADGIFNLCEMKFSISDYAFDKDEENKLRNRIATFQNITKCKEPIMPILVTTYGLTQNIYSNLIQKTITMDDLFK